MIRRRKEKSRATLAIEQLEVRRLLAANTIATAEPISLVSGDPAAVMGEIEVTQPVGEFYIYSLSLSAGDSVTIETVADRKGSDLDTLLRLFNAQGTELDSNDDFDRSVSLDSRLTFEAPGDGTFFVGVSTNFNVAYNPNIANSGGFGGFPGTYDLIVSLTAASTPDTENDTLATADRISFDLGVTSKLSGEIDPSGDVDVFSLQLSAGQTVVFDTDAFSPPDNTLNTLLRVFDANGNEIVRNDDADNTTIDSEVIFEAPNDGIFYVGVSTSSNNSYDPTVKGSGSGGDPGAYDLNVLVTAAVDRDDNDTLETADPIDFFVDTTSTVSGEIDPGGDVDLFSLQLSAGQTVTVDTDAFSPPDDTLNTLLRVFDTNGNEIARNDDADDMTVDSEVTFEVPSDGVFFVGVSGAINEQYDPKVEGSSSGPMTGRYDLNVLVSPAPDENDTIATAENVTFVPNSSLALSGVIDPAEDVDVYRLELGKGDTLSLDIDAATAGSTLDSLLRVFDPSGVELARNDNDGATSDSALTLKATSDGPLFVGVSGANNAAYDANVARSGSGLSVGAFTLNVLVTPAPPPPAQETEPNDDFASANAIPLNNAATATFDTSDDRDVYAFTLSEAGRLTASIFGAGIDSRLDLFTADRQRLISSDDASRDDSNPRIVHHLPAGDYFLVAALSGDRSSTGDYTLTASFDAAGAPLDDVPVGLPATAAAMGDFDGDGNVDLVIANQFTGDVSVLLGLGDGTYRPQVRYLAGAGPTDIVVADFNGDGHDDLAVVNQFFAEVSVLLGVGDGSFDPQAGVLLNVASLPKAIAVGQFNGDDVLDLAVANSASNSVTILLGTGGGSFANSATLATGDGPEALAIGDFDGNGLNDLAVANRTSGDVSILLGMADGKFHPEHRVGVGDQPTSIVVGDFDADGIADLAVANAGSDDVTLLKGLGDGAFKTPVTFDIRLAPDRDAAGDFTSTLIAADFNNDGQLDLVVGNSEDPVVAVALGGGDGTFARRQTVLTSGQPRDLLAADLDGDGRLDLATTTGFDKAVNVRIGLGDGTFREEPRNTVGELPEGSATGDLNGDGRVDLVVANSRGVAVLIGQGNGGFDKSSQIESGNAVAVTVADFNQDGRLDLATANFVDGEVAVMLGLGDGTYRDAVKYAVGELPARIIAADLTGDGLLDLATTNLSSDDISILVGRGDGTFGELIQLVTGDRPLGIVAADVNNDGAADLIVANSREDDLSLFLADGAGGFAAPLRLPAGKEPSGVVVADFNKDGKLDLAAVNEKDNTVSILLGHGVDPSGVLTFSGPESFVVGQDPRELAVADVNGDGILDLVTSNHLSDDVSVLRGQGDGKFVALDTIAVGDGPKGLVIADFNDDGIPDLATTNAFSDDVTVRLGLGDGSFQTPDRFASNRTGATPLFADINSDGIADSVVLNQSGDILLRLGRANEPGIFDSPLVVNPDRPARALTLLESGEETLIAAIDLGSDTVSLYGLSDENKPLTVDQIDTTAEPVRLVAGDVNNDGHQDLIVAGRGELSILLADATGGFQPLDPIAGVADPSALQVADFSGDGRSDILVVDHVSATITLLVNQGDDQFVAEHRLPAGFGPASLVTRNDGSPGRNTLDASVALARGDFNEDGTLDVVVANSGANDLAVLLGKTSGGYHAPQRILTGSRPTAVVVGDLNADGHADLAVLAEAASQIEVFLGNGQGDFTATDPLDAGNSPTGLSLSDANGDGTLDLVVGNRFGDVMTLLGQGDGTFATFTRAGRNVAIAVGDIDGDGQDDWVVANETLDRVAIQLGGEPGAFEQERSDGLAAPGAVATADLNDDGLLDIVVANSGGNNILVYVGIGDGEFEEVRSFAAGTNPVAVTVDDVNDDGRLDVVITNQGSSDVTILLGHENEDVLLRAGPRLVVPDLGGAVDSLVGDFDNDGLTDLLVVGEASNKAFLLAGLGGGFFNDTDPDVFNTGDSPQSAFVGDFDGNGSLDLVTLNFRDNSLSLFPGFDAGGRITISSGGVGPLAGIASDFNGDGALDLVIGNNGNGALSVFLGGESGLVLSNTIDADLQHPTALALAEIGEGSELSLLVADEGDELVRVFGREMILPPIFVSIEDASPSGGPSFAGNITLVLAALTSAFLDAGDDTDSLQRSDDDGSDSNVSDPWRWWRDLLEEVRRFVRQTLNDVGEVTGVELSEEELGDALKALLEMVLPGAQLDALKAIRSALLEAGVARALFDAAVVDQLFEDADQQDAEDHTDDDDQAKEGEANWSDGLQPIAVTVVDLEDLGAVRWSSADGARDEAFARLEQQHRRQSVVRRGSNPVTTSLDRDERGRENQSGRSIDWHVVGAAAVLSGAAAKGYNFEKKKGTSPRLGGRDAKLC